MNTKNDKILINSTKKGKKMTRKIKKAKQNKNKNPEPSITEKKISSKHK